MYLKTLISSRGIFSRGVDLNTHPYFGVFGHDSYRLVRPVYPDEEEKFCHEQADA